MSMVWTPEPAYPKPDISVRATTLYYEIAAPIILPFLERRLLNLFRCREGKCFFQRNREHPPIMPYSARAKAGMPVAAPIDWDELEGIDRSDAFTITDVEQLLSGRRAASSRSGAPPSSAFQGSARS